MDDVEIVRDGNLTVITIKNRILTEDQINILKSNITMDLALFKEPDEKPTCACPQCKKAD